MGIPALSQRSETALSKIGWQKGLVLGYPEEPSLLVSNLASGAFLASPLAAKDIHHLGGRRRARRSLDSSAGGPLSFPRCLHLRCKHRIRVSERQIPQLRWWQPCI